MHSPVNKKKALTPVISSGTMICIAIAVSIATIAWMNGLPSLDMQIEELHVENPKLGRKLAYVDVTLYNNGTRNVKIKSITVNSQLATVVYFSGSNQINSGESAVVRIANTFNSKETWQILFQTTKGNKFMYTVTA